MTYGRDALPSCSRLLVFVCLLVQLSGCGTVYFHNKGDAKAVLAGTEGLAKARGAQTEFLDSQRKHMETAFQEQRAAIIELQLTRRDLDAVAILDADNSSAQVQVAWDKLRIRLKDIEPSIDLGTAKDPRAVRVHETLSQLQEDESELLRDVHALASLSRIYQENGGNEALTCEAGLLQPAALAASANDDARGAFAAASEICKVIGTKQVAIQDARDKAGPAWFATILGSTNRIADLGEGDLRTYAVEAARLRELLTAQQKLASNADKHAKAMQKYLHCLQQQSSTPKLQQEIQQAASQLARYIKWLAEIDKPQAAAADASAPAAVTKQCDSPDTGPATLPAPIESLEQLAGDDDTLPRIDKLLRALGQFSPSRSIIASLQREAQEIRQSELHEVLAALADPSGETAPSHRRAAIAVEAIKLVSLIDSLDQQLPPTSAVLIDLADANLKASNARIEADRLAELTRLAELRFAAVRNEVTVLVSAVDAIKVHDAVPLPTLLRAYTESWTHGRLQASLVEADMTNQEYIAWARRQQAASDAIFAMLEPAFAELKVHADGGFTPEEIAGYLQTLGLGAIAVGVN